MAQEIREQIRGTTRNGSRGQMVIVRIATGIAAGVCISTLRAFPGRAHSVAGLHLGWRRGSAGAGQGRVKQRRLCFRPRIPRRPSDHALLAIPLPIALDATMRAQQPRGLISPRFAGTETGRTPLPHFAVSWVRVLCVTHAPMEQARHLARCFFHYAR